MFMLITRMCFLFGHSETVVYIVQICLELIECLYSLPEQADLFSYVSSLYYEAVNILICFAIQSRSQALMN